MIPWAGFRGATGRFRGIRFCRIVSLFSAVAFLASLSLTCTIPLTASRLTRLAATATALSASALLFDILNQRIEHGDDSLLHILRLRAGVFLREFASGKFHVLMDIG